MASSFVRRAVVPGVPTRITLPSSEVVAYMGLDGQTRTVVLRETSGGGAMVQIQNEEGEPLSFAITAGEAGVYRGEHGSFYGYLAEAEIA